MTILKIENIVWLIMLQNSRGKASSNDKVYFNVIFIVTLMEPKNDLLEI